MQVVVFDGEFDFIATKVRMAVRVWFRFIAINTLLTYENFVPSAGCTWDKTLNSYTQKKVFLMRSALIYKS